MRKIFDVELSGQGRYTELTLPATPWAMQDALEKLCLKEGEAPRWEILRAHSFDNLYPHLEHADTLFELNTLCQQLSLLDERQTAIVEGLIKAEFDAGVKPIPMQRMIDMAYSTDRCHFVEGVTTDAQLGRFSAENGFVVETDDLSDEAFELLDFARIGLKFRQNEGGVFTSQGYVQRHDELRQVSKDMDFTPVKPDYAILAQTANGCEVKLPLPLGEAVADEPVLCVDCAAPDLIGTSGTMRTMDQLAHQLTYLTVNGGLPKYKAVLDATGCDEVSWALDLTTELDQYSLSPDLLQPDETAGVKLEQFLPDDMLKVLLPHVQLCAFGEALVKAQGGKLTEYGLIERIDGSPIQAEEQKPAQGGLEMM